MKELTPRDIIRQTPPMTPGVRPGEGVDQDRRIRRLFNLSEISDILLTQTAESDLNEKFDFIVSKAVDILDAELCSLFLQDGNDIVLRTSFFRDSCGLYKQQINQPIRLPMHAAPGGGLSGYVAYSKKVFNVFGEALHNHPNIRRPGEACDFLPSGYRYSQLASPILDNKKNLHGLIVAYNKKDERGKIIQDGGFIKDFDELLINIICAKVMICIRNDRLFGDLEASLKKLGNYELIVENTPDPVIKTSRDGTITFLNRGAEELLGDIRGKKITDYYFPQDKIGKQQIARDILKRLRTSPQGRISNMETELRGKTGELLPINASISAIKDEKGRFKEFISISKDVRHIRTLIDVGQSLLATNDILDIFNEIAKVTLKMQASNHAYIGLHDSNSKQIIFKAVCITESHHRPEIAAVSIKNGVVGRVFRLGKICKAQENADMACDAFFADTRSQIIAPIKSVRHGNGGAHFLGVIGVDSHSENAFSDHDLYFLSTLAGQAAAVIENSNLITDKLRTITELQALEKVLETITTSLDINLILESLLDAVCDTLGFHYAALAQVDRSNATIGTVKGRNVTPEFLEQARHSLDSDDIQACIVRSKEEVYLVGWDDRLDKNIYEKFGHDKLVRIFLPVLSRDQAFGTLETGYLKDQRDSITENEKEILRKVVKLAGTGIDKAYILEEQRELVEQLQALNQAGSSIQSSRTEEEAVNHFFAGLKQIGYPKGLLSIINKSTEKIEGRYARGANWKQILHETKRELAGEDILAMAVKEKKSLLSKNCQADVRCNTDAVVKAGITAQYVIPLFNKDEAIGTLQVDLSDFPGIIGPQDVLERRLRVLDTFARQIAIAIRNMQDIKTIDILKTTLMETAHEFRSPLHNILTQIGGLRSFLPHNIKQSAEIDDIFKIINEEAQRASRQMENTLLFSEQTRSLRGYNFEKGYIQDVVTGCVNNHKFRALERGIFITVRDNAKRLPLLHFDKQKMEQVFNNLIDNAIKYSHYNRGIQIQGFDDGTHIHIDVWNKGLGIPEAEYDNIFAGFIRGSVKDKTRYIPGTGLGLKISKEIALAHGGTITVKSTPFFNNPERVSTYDGYDTTFTLHLPKKLPEK